MQLIFFSIVWFLAVLLKQKITKNKVRTKQSLLNIYNLYFILYMKKIFFNFTKIAFVAFVCMVAFTACRKECPTVELPPLGDPALSLNGTWHLHKLTETDQVLKAKDKPVLDITDFVLNGGELKISFDAAAKTYAVNSTARINYLGTAGTFGFDDPKFPSKLILTATSGNVLTLPLGEPLRPERPSNLIFKYNRTKRGKASVTYSYTFENH